MATTSHLDTHSRRIVLRKHTSARFWEAYQNQKSNAISQVVIAIGQAVAIAVCCAPYLFVK